MTSSQKIARKARIYYRRELQKEAQEFGRILGNCMKPKPKFIPWSIWMFLVRLVIKTK